MPRQRIVFCDCLDCQEQPAASDVAAYLSPANEAAAKQDPPPKCLLICASGCMQQAPPGSEPATSTSLDACALPHLDKCAREGQVTLLALQQGAGSELEQLLGAPLCGRGAGGDASASDSLSARYKGMAAVFASNSSSACSTAAGVGMATAPLLDPQAGPEGGVDAGGAAFAAGFSNRAPPPGQAAGADLPLPTPVEAARRMLEQLGRQDVKAPDLVCVHLDVARLGAAAAAATSSGSTEGAGTGAGWEAGCEALLWLDAVFRHLNSSTHVRDSVLVAVVLSPGDAGGRLAGDWLQPGRGAVVGAGPAAWPAAPAATTSHVRRPLQSYELPGAGGAAAAGAAVHADRPLLCLRRLPNVVRRDGCERLSLGEWQRSGQGALAAGRLLPELAYKMGCSPKYGA